LLSILQLSTPGRSIFPVRLVRHRRQKALEIRPPAECGFLAQIVQGFHGLPHQLLLLLVQRAVAVQHLCDI